MKLKEVAFRDLFEKYVFLDCNWSDLGIDDEEWPHGAVAMMAFVSYEHGILDGFEMLDLSYLVPVGAEYLEYLKRPSVQEWLRRGFSHAVCLDEELSKRIDMLSIADETIHYHRSWTGYCMFEAKVEPLGDHFIVSEACVNRYPGHYAGTDLEYDKYLLARLITSEIGR